MSYYVLRQIMPRGKSALAHEANAAALMIASVTGGIEYGPYLEWADPEAKDGFGDDGWTDDLGKAKRFATFGDAMGCWKAQSGIRPFRSDGRPNRPLTAYSVQPVRIEE